MRMRQGLGLEHNDWQTLGWQVLTFWGGFAEANYTQIVRTPYGFTKEGGIEWHKG